MNTWLSQITGVAEPLPGILSFHFTFLVSFHSVGGSACGATPVPSGPRHCGQFCSADMEAACAIPMQSNDAEPNSASKGKRAARPGQRCVSGAASCDGCIER